MKRLDPYRFAAGTAVLTGAASGIGEHLAYGLAARGSGLVLLDRDAGRLARVAATIRARHPGLGVDEYVCDLADQAALASTAEKILAAHPRVTLLINNAGVAAAGTFAQLTADEFDWVMRVNFQAPVALTRLLLPRLRQHPGSHIVNLSSVFGLIAPPGQSAYAASKFALRGFSEALRHELADVRIGVTTVHPGGIRTRIAENARTAAVVDAEQAARGRAAFARLLTYPADKAAERILTGVARRRARVLIAWSAVLPDLVARCLPASYWAIATRARPGATSASGSDPAKSVERVQRRM